MERLHRARKQRAQRLLGFIAGFLIICISPRVSVSAAYSDGTQIAPFLFVPVGPKLMVFPSIISSSYPDASLIFTNPAPLALIEDKQLFITSSNWLDDISFGAAGFVWPLMGSEFKAGIGARLMYSGGLNGYNDGMQVISEKSYYDMALTASLSRKLPFLGLASAASLTYLRENLGDISGNGIAFSAGLYRSLGKNSFTVFFENAGGRLAFPDASFDLDASLSFGFARKIKQGWGLLETGGEIRVFRSGAKELRLGADYLLNRFLSLRIGTQHSLSEVESSRYPLSAGLGFRMMGMSIDYAFTPRDYFANTHTFSFSFSFRNIDDDGIVEHSKTSSLDVSYSEGSVASSSSLEYSSKLIRKDLDPKDRSMRDNAGQHGSASSEKNKLFVVAGGQHNKRPSAESEVHALRLLDIPAVMRKVGSTFVVTIGSFDSKAEAEKLVDFYRRSGYSFHILVVEN